MSVENRLRSLEVSTLKSIFGVRQCLSREISISTSKIRKQFQKCVKDFANEIYRLFEENDNLTQTLNHMQEIIDGKEIEIYGLRRQLQSFTNGRSLCSVCARQTIQIESKILHPSKGTNALFELQNPDSRKRFRSDVSLSSVADITSNETKYPAQKPVHKRPCLRSLRGLSTQPKILVRDTQALDEHINLISKSVWSVESQGPCNKDITKDKVNTPSDTSQNISEKDKSDDKSEDTSTLTNSVFPVPVLSPPSQTYDASLAIKNAINHHDLADYEVTYRESVSYDHSHNKGNFKNYHLSYGKSSQMTEKCKRLNRETLRPNNLDQHRKISKHSQHVLDSYSKVHHVTKSHYHKPTCRHYKPSTTKNVVKPPKIKDPDETGADLSLPSDFLESEFSSGPQNSTSVAVPSSQQAIESPKVNANSSIGLPSVGGSPSPEFKCPKPPSDKDLNLIEVIQHKSTGPMTKKTAVHNSPEYTVFKSSRNLNHAPSTPEGFWDLELINSQTADEKENQNNLISSSTSNRYSFRRRRPLAFPSGLDPRSPEQHSKSPLHKHSNT